jgi:hypothetical protein
MEAGNILGVVANYTRILNNWQNEMTLPSGWNFVPIPWSPYTKEQAKVTHQCLQLAPGMSIIMARPQRKILPDLKIPAYETCYI